MSSQERDAASGDRARAASLGDEAAGGLPGQRESAPEPDTASPARPTASRSRLDGLRDAAVPESAENGRGWVWVTGRIAFLGLGALLGTVLSAGVQYAFDAHTAQKQAKREDSAHSAVDDAKPPFSWKLSPSNSEDDPGWMWTLDRKLTVKERRMLVGLNYNPEAVDKHVRTLLGGRRDRPSDYYLQLISERDTSVLITKITATAKRCWNPKVKTRIALEPPAEAPRSWEKLRFDLAGVGTPVPWEINKDPDAVKSDFEPYDKTISLGGTESPGLLKLSLDSSKTCEWQLDIAFNVNVGKTQHKIITKDEYGTTLTQDGADEDPNLDYYLGREFGWRWEG